MKKPTGKLAFAYQTIMALEAKIEAMEKQHDQVTAMWSRDLHKALDTIDRLCDYHVPEINPLYDAAVLGARETLDKLRGASLGSAIAKGTEAWKDVEDSSSWVEELRGNLDA